MAEVGVDIGGGFGLGSDAARIASAILFIQASTNTLDVASALNSSPWTAESFGGDPEKRKACLYYVHQSVAVSAFYCFSAGILAKNIWPVIGWVIAAGYMYFLYRRALDRAQQSGSSSWNDTGSAPSGGLNTHFGGTGNPAGSV